MFDVLHGLGIYYFLVLFTSSIINIIFSGIQVQRSSSSKSSTSSGLNKLAGLGIQISRSEEE